MDYTTFKYILNLLSPHMATKYTNFVQQPIEPAEKLVITLRYFATGASFRSMSFAFRVGASTVSKIVRETACIMWDVLQPIHMPTPTKETFVQASSEFQELWNFPNCIGCIDGKHVRIMCPPHSGTLFFNYKKYYSIVLLAICDAKYRFLVIDVGGFGKQSDGATFNSSELYHLLKSKKINIPANACLPGTDVNMPFVFLADEAFPLSAHVLTPYSSENLNVEKCIFNKRHFRVRKSIECTFGILSSKWRLLSKCIETSHETADYLIKAVCILQNTIIDKEGFERHLTEVETDQPKNIQVPRRPRQRGRQSSDALHTRDTFTIYFKENPIHFPKY
ncbi:unnamed protein product [Acanthoscelides obtectus]|uniref:DDE Tnp4 domain-containing protein n=1 Tax=Acanthoscelides obtectus TaxID=200917 RepID=A0A9P0M0N6_ACAOB|nr:unnamed protein product [Acanthoscelides obtectus]CAK1680534.1 Protein ALP1-like [Acanthoscelides obtectus]